MLFVVVVVARVRDTEVQWKQLVGIGRHIRPTTATVVDVMAYSASSHIASSK